ncbi:unnamed protein product [Hydatigera taeniaeformis]|uniref:RING finger protein n=1 Tax=Hydatigena taeniaeformis TaxID=6205 RepID=A0A0R3WHP2_HYDTA|nr:unnamed protein product [Hydatigera taeniaeformis]
MQSTANNNNPKNTRRDRKTVDSREPQITSQGKSDNFCCSNKSTRSFSFSVSNEKENSFGTNSCPVIDDRSNSASPTRRQPHPAGMNRFRGFGQTPGNEERILEWPPPEPRPIFFRQITPQFGVMFGGLPQLPQNHDVWFFGPTANIQQLIFESGPDMIELDDDNLNEETSPQLSQDHGSGLHRTTSDSSLNTDPRTLETDIGEARTAGELTRLLMSSAIEPQISEAQMPAESGQSLEEAYMELTPGISVTPSDEDVHSAIRIHQANSEPPPRPIFFVIVDTNEGGPADDEQQAAQFHFALMQLLAQLESTSDEEPPVES